ncbi:OprD family outer membrane porin [Stenotrophomonas sp. BIIR7]|uniref:OprD family outer membrane porin n=1 Tax=Stenotrophomonas sp. BIIR7 TaxID=1904462 RepID=UPI00210AE6A8|nr:OprD family outer membrane porin [Stenotrophomonas sp. BIIR7]
MYYHSNDIIGIFYTEGKYGIPLGDDWKLTLAAQYTDQDSAGDNLLRDADFSSRQWGGKAELGWKGALFTTGYTRASGGANMQNPWSGYPGFTSVQVEDFNRNGEGAWLMRASYAFESLKGLSLYALYVDGSDPDSPTEYAKDEYNLNAQWAIAEGALKGLMMRVRYSHVKQKDPLSSDLDDIRLLVYYDPPSL